MATCLNVSIVKWLKETWRLRQCTYIQILFVIVKVKILYFSVRLNLVFLLYFVCKVTDIL